MPFDPIYGPTDSLGDDDLLSLGRAAGYIPDSEQLSPPVEAPMQGGLTPPEPLTSAPAETGPVSPGYPTNRSAGMAMGYRGYSEDQAKKVNKTRPGLNRDLAQADLDAKNAASPQFEAAEMAADSGRGAATNLANAAAQKIKGEGENAAVMQRLYDDFSMEEAKANAAATAQSNQSKADYLASLADFRASRVDPSQLWHNMTGGERFGTLMAAFVHDFLGARGINTSTMNTLNKAIDRNIDAQVQGIKTKGEVAEGFKSLWYMQRNESASETEARARVRGFLLEGAKQAIVSNMAQYESALASAQGQAAVAKIDEELSKNLIDIYRHVDQNSLARRNQAIDQWKTRLSASIEQQNVSLRAQELELQKKELDDKNKALDAKNKTSIMPIYDPETGAPRWYFIPGVSETLQNEMLQSMQGAAELNHSFQQLRELARKAKPINDLAAGTRFQATDQAQFDALATRIAHGFAKANGERATDQDVKDFLKGLAQKTWLREADVDQLIAFTHDNILAQPRAKLSVIAKDLPGSEEERVASFGRSARTGPFEGASTDARNTYDPPAKTTDEIHRGKAAEGAAGVPGQEEPDEVNAETRAAHERAVKDRPDLFGTGATAQEPKSALDTLNSINTGSTYRPSPSSSPIKQFEVSAVELAHLAQKAKSEGVGDDQNTSLNQLKDLAGRYINQGISDDKEAYFAAMLLHEMNQ